MITAREILDVLGRKALVRLMRARNLAPTRENDERRSTLARSYRGDVEALINDMERADLVKVFRTIWFWVGDNKMELRNPSQYRLEELRAFAVRAFAGRRVHIAADFAPYVDPGDKVTDYDDDADEDDDGDEGEDEDDQDGDDSEAEEEDADSEEDDPRQPIFRRVTTDWSRPRLISRILRRLGWDVPQRLRTSRFQELIAALRERQIEACLAYDDRYEVLTERSDSPGIAAKVRLRRGGTTGAVDTVAEPVRTDAGPAITVQAGEKLAAKRPPRPPDYNLAVLRLQLLTAVPSVERRTLPEWPDAYLRAAVRNLALRPQELALLRALSAGLCYGNHSPYDAIPQLSQALSAEDWRVLLHDFVALNPFQPEFVQAIVEQIQPIPTPIVSTDTWRDAAPTPPDFVEGEPDTDKHQMPLAAAAKGAEPEETNVRDLGVLSGMFEDE